MGLQVWPNNDPSNNNATVRVATTANITIATALNNGDSLDGVTLATGDLVLVKNQTASENNGIYTVGITPVRSPNYTAYNDYPGIIVSVTEGSTNADKAFVCTSDSGGTLGTTPISFTGYGTGTIGGSLGVVDNAVPRADGTGGLTAQGSAVIIADTTGVISGTQGVTFTGSSSGTTALVPTAAASGTITLPAATDTLVGKATTDTLTNKTFDADGSGNSITNIENADIKAAAAIAVNKLAAVTVSRALVSDGSGFVAAATTTAAEIGFVNGVTSAIQTQIDTKQATITFGTGVQTALGVNVGSAGAPVLFNGAGGTPSSMTATNLSGTAASLTAGTASAVAVGGITGLGTGVGTALAVNVGSAGAPVLFNGAGGTPSSITLTNASGTAASLTAGTASAVAVGGITGLGTGVATALAVNIGSAGAVITFNGALGTPSSGTLTNATGLPISTGVSGLGTGVATQLALAANGSDVDGIGFRGIPQNSQADNYTLVLADAGKHIYETGATKTVTIPANASVAFEIGTAVTFIPTNATGCSIAITTDTLRWASGGGTGTRTLAQYGVATAIKVTSTEWLISGTGLS